MAEDGAERPAGGAHHPGLAPMELLDLAIDLDVPVVSRRPQSAAPTISEPLGRHVRDRR